MPKARKITLFVEPVPFEEALLVARKKKGLPTTLSSQELRTKVPAQIRRQAAFSAMMDKAGSVNKLAKLAEHIAGGKKDKYGRLIAIPEAKAQMREELQRLGHLVKPEDQGTIKDHTSDRRRQLQVETTVLDIQGHAQHEAGQDAVALQVNPALELVRLKRSVVPRDWDARWVAARNSLPPEDRKGSTDGHGGRKVALKNDPIWQALGDGAGGFTDTLGNPWPPMAFGSGWGWIVVGRRDAMELGILAKGQKIKPKHYDLSDRAKAGLSRLATSLQAELEKNPELQVVDGVLKMRNRLRSVLVLLNARPTILRHPAGTPGGHGGEFAPGPGGKSQAHYRRYAAEYRKAMEPGGNPTPEQLAISSWAGTGRGGAFTVDSEKGKHLLAAMENMPPYSSDKPLYRGLGFDNKEEHDAFIRQAMGDKAIQLSVPQAAVASASASPVAAAGVGSMHGEHEIVIQIDGHRSARDFRAFAHVPGEKEVLFPNSTRFVAIGSDEVDLVEKNGSTRKVSRVIVREL